MPSDELATCFDSAVSWVQHRSGGSTTLISNAFLHLTPLLWNLSLIHDLSPIHCTIESEREPVLYTPWATGTDSQGEVWKVSDTSEGLPSWGITANHCCHIPNALKQLAHTAHSLALVSAGALDHPWAFPGLVDVDEHGYLPDWVLLFEQVQRRSSSTRLKQPTALTVQIYLSII